MQVTREDVLRCASQAHLNLREEEIEPLRRDMERLLSHAEKLNELDLAQVEPMTQHLVRVLPRRADVVGPSLSQAQALSNAPDQEQGHFKVPKVL